MGSIATNHNILSKEEWTAEWEEKENLIFILPLSLSPLLIILLQCPFSCRIYSTLTSEEFEGNWRTVERGGKESPIKYYAIFAIDLKLAT